MQFFAVESMNNSINSHNVNLGVQLCCNVLENWLTLTKMSIASIKITLIWLLDLLPFIGIDTHFTEMHSKVDIDLGLLFSVVSWMIEEEEIYLIGTNFILETVYIRQIVDSEAMGIKVMYIMKLI